MSPTNEMGLYKVIVFRQLLAKQRPLDVVVRAFADEVEWSSVIMADLVGKWHTNSKRAGLAVKRRPASVSLEKISESVPANESDSRLDK